MSDASKKALRALGRLPAGTMNRLEAEYAKVLEQRRHDGNVLWFSFEGMRYKLADKTYYVPDFSVMLSDGTLEMHEVKGHWEDDARVKIKVAAVMFPVRFIGVRKALKKDGGGWNLEYFS